MRVFFFVSLTIESVQSTMDFFKFVFSDDVQPQSPHPPTDPSPNPGSSSTWRFGGLVKGLASKSESVIESHRKDFEELGSGLKKETEIIRSVASRAVTGSLDIGASVAQGKLESVGQAIYDIDSSVWKSTAQIIFTVKIRSYHLPTIMFPVLKILEPKN